MSKKKQNACQIAAAERRLKLKMHKDDKLHE